MCEEMISLIMHILNHDGDSLDDVCIKDIPRSVLLERASLKLETVINNSWSPWLLGMIGSIPTLHASAVAIVLSNVRFDNFSCSHHSLSATVPNDDKLRFDAMQNELLDDVRNGNSALVAQKKEQLVGLSELLTSYLDSLLLRKDSIVLKRLDFIELFFEQQNSDFIEKLVGRLQVKHYGFIVGFVRQTLGLVSLHSIRFFESPESSVVHEEKIQNICEDFVIPSATVRSHIYCERVPPEWETCQEKNEGKEYTKSSVLILKEEDSAFPSQQEEDKAIITTLDSCNVTSLQSTVVDTDYFTVPSQEKSNGDAISAMKLAGLYQRERFASNGFDIAHKLKETSSSAMSDQVLLFKRNIFQDIATDMEILSANDLLKDDIDGVSTLCHSQSFLNLDVTLDPAFGTHSSMRENFGGTLSNDLVDNIQKNVVACTSILQSPALSSVQMPPLNVSLPQLIPTLKELFDVESKYTKPKAVINEALNIIDNTDVSGECETKNGLINRTEFLIGLEVYPYGGGIDSFMVINSDVKELGDMFGIDIISITASIVVKRVLESIADDDFSTECKKEKGPFNKIIFLAKKIIPYVVRLRANVENVEGCTNIFELLNSSIVYLEQEEKCRDLSLPSKLEHLCGEI